VTVRRAAVQAWRAAGRYDGLGALLGDPDPEVRREIALAFREAPDSKALEPLARDPDEAVRASRFAVLVLRGEMQEQPRDAAISRAAAAEAMRQAVPVDQLREVARDHHDPAQRLAAALALGVMEDEVAHQVSRTDPQWQIRDKVSRMLAPWREPGDGARHSA
jgi:hypothetical protein